MGWAAEERNLVFYADDRRVAVRDHGWVQDALMVTVAMFHRMGLLNNLKKTKAMICSFGFIWGDWKEAVYKQWLTGEGATFRDQKKTCLSCTKYGVTVEAA